MHKPFPVLLRLWSGGFGAAINRLERVDSPLAPVRAPILHLNDVATSTLLIGSIPDFFSNHEQRLGAQA
jgi:hypothetical protein